MEDSMSDEEATTTESIALGVSGPVPNVPPAQEQPTGETQESPASPTPQEQFLNQVHDRLMMAHALVVYSILSTDAHGTVLKLTDTDLARARYAAGVLIYGDESGQWSYAGDGLDGTEADSPACVLVRCKNFPARS